MVKWLGIVGPKLEQIWAWPHSGHQRTVGVYDPLKSLDTGPSLLNNYLENKFHK